MRDKKAGGSAGACLAEVLEASGPRQQDVRPSRFPAANTSPPVCPRARRSVLHRLVGALCLPVYDHYLRRARRVALAHPRRHAR